MNRFLFQPKSGKACALFWPLFTRYCNTIALALGLGLSFAPETLHAETLPIDQILSSEKPYEIYRKVFSSFQFISRSSLALEKNTTDPPATAESTVEVDSSGNYHLLRTPFRGQTPVEVVSLNQKVYLRLGESLNFQQVTPLDEFQRWLNKAFRELFSMYEQDGFGKEGSASSKGELSCRSKPSGTLCADTKSGLPMEGSLTYAVKGVGTIQTQFTVSLPQKKKFEIRDPQKQTPHP